MGVRQVLNFVDTDFVSPTEHSKLDFHKQNVFDPQLQENNNKKLNFSKLPQKLSYWYLLPYAQFCPIENIVGVVK